MTLAPLALSLLLPPKFLFAEKLPPVPRLHQLYTVIFDAGDSFR